MNEEMLKQIMEDDSFSQQQKDLAQLILGDGSDAQERMAERARNVTGEIMEHVKAIQQLIDDNQFVMRVIDFAVVLNVSMMGVIDLDNPEPSPDEKQPEQGVRMTRTIAGPKSAVKALITDLVRGIRAEDDKEDNDE